MTKSDLCEIRVPTYKRPALLARALRSLLAQTHDRWRCVVFDDSPDGEGEAVVAAVKDPRIEYRKNTVNLGILENLRQCFETRGVLGGNFACLLEDDHFFFPDCLARNIASLDEAGVNILLQNQQVERNIVDNQPGMLIDRTLLSSVLWQKNYDPMELLYTVFTGRGIPNGALFWRTNCLSRIELGAEAPDPILQEYARPFLIRETVVYAAVPLASWRENAAESYRISPGRSFLKRLYRNTSISLLRRIAIAGMEREKPLDAWVAALPVAHREAMTKAIALSGALTTHGLAGKHYAPQMRGLAARLLPHRLDRSLLDRIDAVMNSKKVSILDAERERSFGAIGIKETVDEQL